jgi:chemotaxis protein MotB
MRRHKQSSIEENQDTDRWLISYADFITLLFAFFVVMYSISQVNESKYQVLTSSLIQAFDIPQSSNKPIQIGEINRSLQPVTGDDIEQPELDSETIESGRIDSENFASTEEFKDLENGLRTSLGGLINQNLADIKSDANWIDITLQSGLLFPSGSDLLNSGASPLLEEVSKHINSNKQMLLIHGHTDNIPIDTERFPSNWDLSSARAVAVVRELQKLSVYAPRMSVEGHGEFQPVAPNDSVENRAKNRRVVISISRKQRVTDVPFVANEKLTSTEKFEETNEKDVEEQFEIVRLANGELVIRGKE